jgi:DNA polymerase-3 subunit alpha
MAAVLSMQDKDEKKAKYIKVCQDMGITIKVPDINLSGENFTAVDNTTITYGLSSVKGVNNVSDIIANRPYTGIEDAVNRLPKKSFNKTVGSRLIKCGAFDSLDGENRNAILKKFYTLRKDKDIANESEYTRATAIEYELESIGINITFKTNWEKLLPGQRVFNAIIHLETCRPYKTKKGSMMAYATVKYDGVVIPAIVFPKAYAQYEDMLIPGLDLSVNGSRAKDKNELIIDSIKLAEDTTTINSAPIFDPFASIGA